MLEFNRELVLSFRPMGEALVEKRKREELLLNNLVDKKIITLYEGLPSDLPGFDNTSNDIGDIVKEKMREIRKEFGPSITPSQIFSDIVARSAAARLANEKKEEFDPILPLLKSFGKPGRKAEVFQFILQQMPVPFSQTPWEAIIDFRQDESTRLKYLELIDWINSIAATPLTTNEISEKLEYLTLEYKRAFKRHKMKTRFKVLEVLMTMGLGFLASDYRGALNLASNLIKVGTSTLDLQGEEGKLPGKEIAYIYHTNQVFQD